jgi:hypothetical protein
MVTQAGIAIRVHAALLVTALRRAFRCTSGFCGRRFMYFVSNIVSMGFFVGYGSFSRRIDFADCRAEILRSYSEKRGIFLINLLVVVNIFVECM